VANGGETSVLAKEFLSDLTLDVIGLAAFGFDFKASLEQSDCVASAFRLLTKGEVILVSTFPGFKYVTSMINFIAKIVGPVSSSLVIQILYWVDQMHKCVVDNIVNSRNNNRTEAQLLTAADQRSQRQNLLDCIVDSSVGGEISDSELQDMIMTFIVAGHETSSIALSWLLLLLAEHPDWQLKCRQEIISVEGNVDQMGWDDVSSKFPVLKACIFESLRLFPPAPYINRKTVAEDYIGGYKIPPKTDILVMICDIHRDPDIWVNPDEFQPDRFLDENSVPFDAFMPFGDGVHKCIGYKFALVEVTIIAVKLLEKFHVGTLPNRKYREKATVTLVPVPDLELSLRLLDTK